MILGLITYILLMLIPINGLILVAMRNERRRNARIVRELWRLKGRR